MKLITWNVNGIRACQKKGFLDFVISEQPDILCIQETKIHDEIFEKEVQIPDGYHLNWFGAERKGYSGVATYCKKKPKSITHGFGVKRFDVEGRVLITDHTGFTLLNVYFPNGTAGDHRLEYKLDFYDALLDTCTDLKNEGKKLIVCGDYNIAHTEIDIARPKENSKTSGFLPIERARVDDWLAWGFVDIFRTLHPDAIANYSWWSFRSNARANNVGWRIDYHLVSKALTKRCQDARILMDVMGSDHCPVVLEIK